MRMIHNLKLIEEEKIASEVAVAVAAEAAAIGLCHRPCRANGCGHSRATKTEEVLSPSDDGFSVAPVSGYVN